MSDLSAHIRDVRPADLDTLIQLEEIGFSGDRLSRRSFQRWMKKGSGHIFRVLTCDESLVGYGLVLLHKGTHLARMYSIVLHPSSRGKGFGKELLYDMETCAEASGRFFMRLEVSKQNVAAVQLYKKMGYRVFGEKPNYYEDHTDALRMQKRIRFPAQDHIQVSVPWYKQTTPFTCGPASLAMAMKALKPNTQFTQASELDIWREATTIYMTSGHGGCHPLGLALAAKRRGFDCKVLLSQRTTPFLEGVRIAHKKEILQTVHQHFLDQCETENISIRYSPVTVASIQESIVEGLPVLVLISSYRMNGDKAPHWVVVTGSDDLCFYVNDPDTQKITTNEVDCQHIPVAKADFAKMVTYGTSRFSAALCLSLR